MPIRDDLIQRLLDQLGEVAARVLAGRAPEALQQAERELASAYVELTGSGRTLVARLSSEQLLAILGAPSRFNRERGYVLARLLEIDAALVEAGARQAGTSERAPGADLSAAAGAVDTPPGVTATFANDHRLKALDLYLEAALAGLGERDLADRIAALQAALAQLALPERSHWRTFEYAAAGGRFAKAEDLLFEGIERFGAGSDLVARGLTFYRELQARSDAELQAGGLPRAEVLEGRAAFEAEAGRATGTG